MVGLVAGLLLGTAGHGAGFLFTSFRGNGDGLHLAYSSDALRWTEISGTFLTSKVGGGLMRDPHVLKGPDGVFRLVWTSGWGDKGIGYASSKDLMKWSEPKYLPVMESTPGTKNCWAPETLYDPETKQYAITWSSDVEGRFPETVSPNRMNNRTYYVTTKDFSTFSQPKVFLDPGFDHIDTTVIQEKGKWIAVFKEGDMQSSKRYGPIFHGVSDHALGPYTVVKAPILTERAEGPSLVSVGGKTRMYVDYYTEGKYGVYETSDWKTWTDVSKQSEIVPGQRHGTILPVSGAAITAVRREQDEAISRVPKPILDGFTADPAIRVFGNRYYVYPTSDKPNWQTTDFSVWSSPDLIHWKKERMVMDVTKDLKWANIEAWAPDVMERDGKYYFYFCAQGQIGVAVGDQPTGPFKDALGHALIPKGSVKTYPIDPYPFMDDDGQAYLYFGNGTPMVYRLNKDMVSFDGPPATIPMKDFREGYVVFKRKGLYYFMWSIDDARSDDYRVGYGISKSPYGPVEIPANNIVLKKNGPVKGTGHHSVVNVPGTDRWYVAYHRHAIPGGSGFKRETCLAKMEFNEDGTIKPIDPMIPAFPSGSKGEPLGR